MTTPTAAALPASPIAFPAAGAWCFGWFHPAREPVRDMAVVLCRPLGFEAMCSHPSLAQLAERLADAGFPVVRFDYHGTGDSAGDEREPGRVQAWLDSIAAAAAEARALGRVPRIALLGVRAGATLATVAAARLGGVDSLVLWAPCPTGRAFVRELRAAGTASPDEALDAMGYHYTAETVADLQALDCTRLPAPPARRALVIGRDDLGGEGPVPAALCAHGVNAQFAPLPGYAAMMREPHEGVLDAATVAAITEWLAAAPTSADAPAMAAAQPPQAVDCVVGGVRERPLRIGAAQSLFGVLAEPAAGAPGHRAAHTGVVLLNVGGNHHVGPHRIYVELARTLAASGYRALRLDLAGIGDSRPAPGTPYVNLYNKDSTADVRAAIDALAAQGCREFVLMGICSGSYVAFQTALVEPRVHTQVLMNSRLLEWQPGHAGDTWQASMQRYYKSRDFYLRALLRADSWRRLAAGQVDVRGIAGRFLELGTASLRRLLQRAAGRGDGGESLLAKMKRVCARGTDTLMLIAEDDDGRDYVEFHFGRLGKRLRGQPNFRMVMVAQADHTFSPAGARRVVFDTILAHLAARPAPAGPAPEAGYNGGLATARPV